MSDVMLFGVLRMPLELWTDDALAKSQLHGCCLEAADRIEELERERDELREQNERHVREMNMMQLTTLPELRAKLSVAEQKYEAMFLRQPGVEGILPATVSLIAEGDDTQVQLIGTATSSKGQPCRCVAFHTVGDLLRMSRARSDASCRNSLGSTALAADKEAAEQRAQAFEKLLEGIPQDAIDGGWTARGLENYALGLEQDAARYRWLRNGGWEVMRDPKYWTVENRFDGAIDAGMMDVALNASQWRAQEEEDDSAGGGKG